MPPCVAPPIKFSCPAFVIAASRFVAFDVITPASAFSIIVAVITPVFVNVPLFVTVSCVIIGQTAVRRRGLAGTNGCFFPKEERKYG